MSYFRHNLTPGIRAFATALALVGLAGAIVALFASQMLSGDTFSGGNLTLAASWSGLCGAVGTIWSTILCLKWLGFRGTLGALQVALAVVSITFMSSVAAGTLILPLYGTMFGPLSVVMTFINTPALAAAWVGAIVYAHVLIARWRDERESIFEFELPAQEQVQTY